MTRPPPSGPHSDIDGVFRDSRHGVPNRDPAKGSAKELEQARRRSAGRPDPSDERSDSAGKSGKDRD